MLTFFYCEEIMQGNFRETQKQISEIHNETLSLVLIKDLSLSFQHSFLLI